MMGVKRCLAAGSLTLLGMTACDGAIDPDCLLEGRNCGSGAPLADVELHVHPDDAVLIEATVAATGQRLVLVGDKEADGTATRLTRIDGVDPVTDEVTSAFFGDDGRPYLLVAPSGEQYALEFVSDTRVVVTGTAADGVEEERVTVDLAEPLPATASVPTPSELPEGTQTFGTTERVLVSVTECGVPVADACPVTIQGTIAGERYHFPHICTDSTIFGDGIYDFIVPRAPYEGVYDVTVLCKGVTFVLRKVSIAVSVGFAGVCTGYGPLGTVACRGAFSLLDTAADYVGINPVAALGREQCEGASINLEPLKGKHGTLSYDLTASARIGTRRKKTPASGTLVLGDSWPTIAVDFVEKAATITTSPLDPDPGQDYTARAALSCAGMNTVSLSVSGDDGYSSLNQQTGGDSIELLVPGADASVVDTLTVIIGTETVKQTTITF